MPNILVYGLWSTVVHDTLSLISQKEGFVASPWDIFISCIVRYKAFPAPNIASNAIIRNFFMVLWWNVKNGLYYTFLVHNI